MALALNSNHESAEHYESEVESARSGFSKLVKNVLEWGAASAVASAALNGVIAGVTGGIGTIIPAAIWGFGVGGGLGGAVGGVQSLWHGLKNWRRK
jgi:hypothetical protein